jgi:mono/diheme cytochrome c family protein
MKRLIQVALLLSAALYGQPAPFPDGPGKDTTQRLCGSCHSATLLLGRGMTREQWSEIVTNMITRGAKGSPAEFAAVIEYLSQSFPVKEQAVSAPVRKSAFPMGPTDQQVVDVAAAQRGKTLYATACLPCHGPLARGSNAGPDLTRSVTILHDRYGSALIPYLHETHPGPARPHVAALNDDQIKDLSHFLHQQFEDTLRGGPYSKVLNVLTGNASAGSLYFNGAGGCSACHSAAGDLAGIASRYDPPNLQQRLLFPRVIGFSRNGASPPKPVTVTVTEQGGKAVTGTVVRLDDFTVSLKDASGEFHAWTRTPQLTVEKHDPYAAHDELLDKYTDKDIHNLVAYLETLK